MEIDFKIKSSVGSVVLYDADSLPTQDNIENLRSLERPADKQAQIGGRPRGKADRSRTLRPAVDPGAANLVAPRRIEKNPTTFARTGANRYISKAYGSEPSCQPIPSFDLSFGNGNVSVKIGGNSQGGVLPTDNGGRLTGKFQNTDCFGTGSDYLALSSNSGSDSSGTGGVVTGSSSVVAQTGTDSNADVTTSQTSTVSVQSGNATPTDDELKAMGFSDITAMFKAQSADDTTKMIARWSPDGQPITKEQLSAINPALAEKVFEQYPGDSIDVSKLTAFATALKTTAASSQEDDSTRTNGTATNGTGTDSTGTTSTVAPSTTASTTSTPTTTPTSTSASASNESNPTTTPTAPTTTPATSATPTSDATTAGYSEIDAKVRALLAKFAPKDAAAAKTHEALCKLAAKIARPLTGDKKKDFLTAVETLGAAQGLNYGLSRTTAAGKVPLNQSAASKGGSSTAATDAGTDASSAADNKTPTTPTTPATPTTATTATTATTPNTANPMPTAEELTAMKVPELAAMLVAQTDEQTTTMIKGWSTDNGDKVTKAKLVEINPVLTEIIFKGISADSVNVSDLTTWALQQKEAAKKASAGTATPTSTTPQTGTTDPRTAVDGGAFSKLDYTGAMAAIKNETEINTVTRVKKWSTDGVNISKADLEKANPQLAARFKAFATNPSATVTIADMAEALNAASTKARATTMAGKTQ